MKRLLFLFDFDYSLIDVDSDIWIFEKLRPDLLKELEVRWKQGHPCWVDLCDEMLLQLQKDLDTSQDSVQVIKQVMKYVPLHPKMKEMLELVKSHPDFQTDLIIMSDANNLYISSILEHNDLLHQFTKIYTNPISKEDGQDSKGNNRQVVRINRLFTTPHNCEFGCAVNMCKGALVDKHVDLSKYDLVCYLGDGKNDFCPSTRLPSNGIVFARQGRALVKCLEKDGHLVNAKVHVWSEAPEVYEAMSSIVHSK